MPWLIVAILAYFFLAVVSLFDRYFLVGPVPNPKVYTFYVGMVGFFACLVLFPFVLNSFELNTAILGIITGLTRFIAILFLSVSIIKSEISRVVPAVGGFLPIFSFLLFFLFFPTSGVLNLIQGIAFILLIVGSILISLEKKPSDFFAFRNLRYPILTAFLFALTFFLAKKVYLETDFLYGLFLILLGGVLGAFIFLIFPDVRKSVFEKRNAQKMSLIFLIGQAFGGLGMFLQQYAVFLAKPVQVPLINALEGARYVFLLFFVIFLFYLKKDILKEEVSKKILFQKIAAILLIGAGLAILALM